MAQGHPASPRPPGSAVAAGALPTVRLDVRHGPARATTHEVGDVGFLIGSVPGCDLRLPGTDLPPVICLISRSPAGASLRKLLPTQPLLVNGRAFSSGALTDGDRLTLGTVEILIQVVDAAPGADAEPREDHPRQLEARERQLDEQTRELEADRVLWYERREQIEQELRQQRELLGPSARPRQDTTQLADLERQRRLLEEQRQLLVVHEQDVAARLESCQAGEAQLATQRDKLHKEQAEYQSDLVRLHRLQATLEEREQQLQARSREVEERFAQMRQTSEELEEQAQQLDAWETRLHAEADKFARHKTEQETATAQMLQRSASFEGQQAMLASLRTRLERMREDVRREEEQIAEQRTRLQQAEADLDRRSHETERLRTELERESQSREQERRRFAERGTVMEQAVARLRQVQETVATEEERLQERILQLNAVASEQAEEASVLRARSAQVLEMQQRLEADRQALRERETSLAQTEQVRGALQEQLRRRSEELAGRQRALAEQARLQDEAQAALELRRAEIEHERRQTSERLVAAQNELEARATELERLQTELTQRDETLQRHRAHLKEAGRAVARERKAVHEQRTAWEAAQQEAAAVLAREQAAAEVARRDMVELQQQLPDLQLRAEAAGERLAQARAQLREHLAEVHAYAQQSHGDLEALREQVQAEAEQLRQRELALHRARDEHRLAVTAFRQQLIEWQGQVAEMKRALAHDETRLERRQARVEEQQRHVEETSAQLAQKAETLQEQERAVAEQRSDMERHLADLREWYRRKLRELMFGRTEASPAATMAEGTAGPLLRTPAREEHPDILSLTGDLEPGDRQLGDLLRSLGLIDAETLTALLVEARKQRRSLRQALLGGGFLTLYQIALIEAGNIDGLVLGPLRVIDRLRMTPREAIYRVFDPRRGREVVLRHLADVEMQDAVHPDEYRQRFVQAAALEHPNLAMTLETLDIAGRPAVVQEWLSGLASSDWPPLAAVPGVWFRLVHQATQALHAAHQGGLTHCHLHADQFVLTRDGVLKLCGLGEPLWLVHPPVPASGGEEVQADLRSLGQVFGEWADMAVQLKTGKAKPLPERLRGIVDQLLQSGYVTSANLLVDLDQAGSALPDNAEAWERLLRHVREHALPGVALRQSA